MLRQRGRRIDGQSARRIVIPNIIGIVELTSKKRYMTVPKKDYGDSEGC